MGALERPFSFVPPFATISVPALGCRMQPTRGAGRLGDVRMEDGKFTMFAGKAVALAEVFKFTVGKELFVGTSVCRLELSAPTEESTDGGRLAVQHVSIVPENGGPSTVIVTAYQVDRRAEARPYEVVADMYKKRFRTNTFPVSPGQLDEMTRKLKDFFLQFGFKFEIAPLDLGGTAAPTRHPTAGALPLPAPKLPTGMGGSANLSAARGSRMWMFVAAMALVAAAASCLAVYLLGH
jgi:hypothetical protein